MALLTLDNIALDFGPRTLFRDASLVIEQGERICLIGRNGAGKSTLLQIIAGTLLPDRGERRVRDLLRISKLEQDLPGQLELTVREVVAGGLAGQAALRAEYERLAQDAGADMDRLDQLQAELDAGGGWELELRVDRIITQLGLPAERQLSDLSGGWRRRVALGQALVSDPDLLLLDEPTNHLDIHTIEWLENRMLGFRGSVLFITHDRRFLQRLATRIVEIDRGELTSWPGDYNRFLDLKEKADREEDERNALFDKRLAKEEAWIRQGIKARRTRNEGRVRALQAMRRERGERIKREGSARMNLENAEASGRKVIEARSISHALGGRQLLRDFRFRVMRGDRIGLVGNNGVGKSTLLRILLGELTPDAGSVKLGTNLNIAYFDQLRQELQRDKTVADNVGEGREFISINGKERHIISYLQDFLFSPERSRTKVSELSGGECNRVLLAKLFSKPCNLLVMDEPTNDLDVEMLEALEQRLLEFDGTLLLVSHDRAFLDNVVTSVLVFEADNVVREYVGGYSDWLQRGAELKVSESEGEAAEPAAAPVAAETAPVRPEPVATQKKLSYKLQRELDLLPARIADLETRQQALQKEIAAAGFYEQAFEQTEAVLEQLADTERALEQALDRWVELESS